MLTIDTIMMCLYVYWRIDKIFNDTLLIIRNSCCYHVVKCKKNELLTKKI